MAYVKFKLCFKQKILIIYTLHGFRHNHLLKSYVAHVIIGLGLLCFADKVICMSGYLRKKFKLLSYKIELLPLGVSTSFFSGNYCPLPQNGLQMILVRVHIIKYDWNATWVSFRSHSKAFLFIPITVVWF